MAGFSARDHVRADFVQKVFCAFPNDDNAAPAAAATASVMQQSICSSARLSQSQSVSDSLTVCPYGPGLVLSKLV